MPAGDEEGIGSAHVSRITRNGASCRDRFADRSTSVSLPPGPGQAKSAHDRRQPPRCRSYSGPHAGSTQPCRTQFSDSRRGGCGRAGRGRCWQSHHVPPGHSVCCCLRQCRQTMSVRRGDPPDPPDRRCAPNAGSAGTPLRRAPPHRRAAALPGDHRAAPGDHRAAPGHTHAGYWATSGRYHRGVGTVTIRRRWRGASGGAARRRARPR